MTHTFFSVINYLFPFYRYVRKCYVSVVSTIIRKFPLDNPVLQAVSILNPQKRLDFSEQSGNIL